MKHLLSCAALALSLSTLAQPAAITSSSPRPAEITCCTDKMSWANAQDVVDSMALSEWQLLQTMNNHLHVGSISASRRWSSGQLDSIALLTVTKNAQRYYAMTRLWIYGPTGPGSTCTTWFLSDSSACVNGSRTYTYIKLPSGCAGTPPGPTPPASKPCTTAPQCTSYSPVTWGACVNGTQTGTYTKLPAGCQGTPPGSVPVTSRTCTSNYSIMFSGLNPIALPGCNTVQPWQGPTITGVTAITTRNTWVPFSAPQTAVKSMVLKNYSGTDVNDTWINDQVRILNGKFVLASDKTKVLGTVPATKQNVTLTFSTAVTISNLLGSPAYNTAKFTVEGIDLIK